MKLVLLLLCAFAFSISESSVKDMFDEYSSMELDHNNCSTPMIAFPDESSCTFSIFPCSYSITGNLILCLFYGVVLGVSAKFISDGAELLLELGLPAGIIGGVVLPLLGAIPDSAMIIFSGINSNKTVANTEISVGMGTLAGSTIMLLTLPWLASLIIGRVDIVNGVGKDETTSSFTIKSFFKQGVTVFPDVTYSAIIMLITTIPYFIVQGADWHFGPTRNANISEYNVSGQPTYIRYSSLATFILAFLFLIAYLVFQVIYSVNSLRKENARKEIARHELLQRRVVKMFLLSGVMKTKNTIQNPDVNLPKKGEAAPLLEKDTRRIASVWRAHRAKPKDDDVEAKSEQTGETTQEDHDNDDSDHDEPKWKICVKSIVYLIGGVAAVTIFSDPMVTALTSLTDTSYKHFALLPSCSRKGQYIPIPVFYVSFIVTPICSNASELVSSLVFASKRKIVNTSMTYSQLYGAATMNNTLCLGVFAALVFFNELDWQFSAEVTVILVIEFSVGIIALITGFGFKHTYLLIVGCFVGLLYFFSIFLVAALENFAHWK